MALTILSHNLHDYNTEK
uniref:Uncharacterized protein n=1 Tax=Anguilla anguilla TaxID=7936 RepID=A0A0E9V8D2_ANGAN